MSKVWKCSDCGALHTTGEFRIAPHPFRPSEELRGCPKCGSIEDARLVCDQPGCEREAICGWPSPAGYRDTCHEHSETGGGK